MIRHAEAVTNPPKLYDADSMRYHDFLRGAHVPTAARPAEACIELQKNRDTTGGRVAGWP